MGWSPLTTRGIDIVALRGGIGVDWFHQQKVARKKQAPFACSLQCRQDLDDDWEDLDDLLEGALLERQKDGGINEHGVSGAQSAEKTAVDRDARLDSKLSDIDRLLTSEAASVAASSEASTAAAFEIAGVGANEAMDTFLAGGEMGRGGAGGKSSASVPGDFLGDEEEQLMQMVGLSCPFVEGVFPFYMIDYTGTKVTTIIYLP